jgi:hypothetical protein
MSLTQQLLLRSLVARFWKEPYRPPRLARWGTELHDRFMLPYFVQQDFADVLAEQRAAGFPFADAWFAPHFEFRFPRYGDYETRGVEMEIRHALEPWHVMGEEGAPGGTVRYVDSSVERVQVKVSGLAPDRYAIACNGHALPLRPTGNACVKRADLRSAASGISATSTPLATSTTRCRGVIDVTQPSTCTEPAASSRTSPPGPWPFTVRPTRGPVVTNVRPWRTPFHHASALSGAPQRSARCHALGADGSCTEPIERLGTVCVDRSHWLCASVGLYGV